MDVLRRDWGGYKSWKVETSVFFEKMMYDCSIQNIIVAYGVRYKSVKTREGETKMLVQRYKIGIGIATGQSSHT